MRRAVASSGIALSTALLAGAVAAREEMRPLASSVADAVESCVDTSTIAFTADGGRHVLLAADDAALVARAIALRYPVVEREGLVPESIVLWRKPAAGWLYVSLLANPSKPGEVCFTATFVATRFDPTAGLVEKYFGSIDAAE